MQLFWERRGCALQCCDEDCIQGPHRRSHRHRVAGYAKWWRFERDVEEQLSATVYEGIVGKGGVEQGHESAEGRQGRRGACKC